MQTEEQAAKQTEIDDQKIREKPRLCLIQVKGKEHKKEGQEIESKLPTGLGCDI